MTDQTTDNIADGTEDEARGLEDDAANVSVPADAPAETFDRECPEAP